MIEFCFDEEFYPEILKNYKPHERFAIYKNAKDEPNIFSREETFRVTSFHIPGTPVSDFIKDKDFVVKEMKKIDTTPELSGLANHLKISGDELKRTLVYPKALDRYYYFSSVYEILNLEFTKLLETDIRFKKWKYEALSKRNDCTMGSISCEEFANWNEAYFPNRTKKPSEN